ncbi:hypothetical protein AVEN_61300-1 [Araneus ventricosus]|uniref:Uncharacterized protein n=1 Tax=Araneus ventricosus TaxID=182803 RepID=A0A4Y2NAT7_ARAVE|nr:hypothetical protein AVEN_61300-1 [Araneus ventricosus]
MRPHEVMLISTTERFYNRQNTSILEMNYFHRFHSRSHRDSSCQHNGPHFATMSLLDESRWKKRGERYAMVITDDRRNAARLRSSTCYREQCSSRRMWTSMSTMHRETLYTSRVNRNFRCFEKKRQYKHRNGDDCITSILSDASKIGTVLQNIYIIDCALDF